MTKREKINRNIGLTFDFLRQVIKDPKLVDKVPDGSILEFVEKDFAKVEIPKKRKALKDVRRRFLRVNSNLELIK
ncbi:MAG: hypothetical protein K2U26_13205 [Cyclobacteriaceae bacterium]|nr:hypothetical protein [Cyclobacteriaceae bacterium]